MKKLIVIFVTVAFVLITSVTVSAHQMGQRQGMMGQGMMGQGMMGQGMMGQGMMGQGMMGQGMMGQGMMGPGMHRMMAINSLSLSEDQQKEISTIRTNLRNANWGLKGAMMDHRDKLTELYNSDVRDAEAISNVYSEMFNLKQQMIKNVIEADNKAYALLDDEQRKQLKQSPCLQGAMGSGRHHRHMMMN